jgi:hypothetical protein
MGMAGYVNVRAYAELNDFLGPESRAVTVRRPFRPHQTVKDVLEAMGIGSGVAVRVVPELTEHPGAADGDRAPGSRRRAGSWPAT